MRKLIEISDLGIAHRDQRREGLLSIMEDIIMRGSNSSTSSRSSRSSSGSSSSSSRGRSRRGGRRTQTPVSRMKNSISNRITKNSRGRSSSSGIGFWGYVLGGVCLAGIGYGLSRISSVRSFMKPVLDPVSNLFGLLEDDGIDTSNLTHDRTYSGSSVGSSSMVHQ
jgi:hypothetical protein